jgi:hypothetical protein
LSAVGPAERRISAHVHPAKLNAAILQSRRTPEDLAQQVRLQPHRLREVLEGERALGKDVGRRLEEALGLADRSSLCFSGGRGEPCASCRASNSISDSDMQQLASALVLFLQNAADYVKQTQRGPVALVKSAWTERGELFVGVEGFAEARSAACALGGDLTVEDLERTGVAGLLGSGNALPVAQLGMELARYAARGDCPSLVLVALDAHGFPPEATALGDWELVRLRREQVRALAPVPQAADHSRPGWDQKGAELTWWLRRHRGIRERTPGTVISLTDDPYAEAIAPLLAIALAGLNFAGEENRFPPFACPVGRFDVEVGNRVRHIAGSTIEFTEDDEVGIQTFSRPYSLPVADRGKWRDVVSKLGLYLRDVQSASGRAPERFLRAGHHYLRGAVLSATSIWPQQETVFQWMTALEVLLSDGNARGGYSGGFKTNAAWLGGFDDADRHGIRQFAGTLYDAGSKYRHGAELYELNQAGPTERAERRPPGKLDVRRADRLVRRLMLNGLALLIEGLGVSELCGKAQHQRAAGDRIAESVRRLHDALGIEFRPFA